MVLLFCHFSLFRSEKGTFYALDLGGTNFRVLRVHLGGQRSLTLKHDVERQPIPQNLMTGTREVATVNMRCRVKLSFDVSFTNPCFLLAGSI